MRLRKSKTDLPVTGAETGLDRDKSRRGRWLGLLLIIGGAVVAAYSAYRRSSSDGQAAGSAGGGLHGLAG